MKQSTQLLGTSYRLCRLLLLIVIPMLIVACGMSAVTSINVPFYLPGTSQITLPNASVMPGSSLQLGEVTSTDESGGQRTLNNEGEDGESEYTVTVRGGTFDPVSNQVNFSENPAEIPAEGYEVIVEHADGARSVTRFTPDFASVNGPEPGDLQSFDVRMVWEDGNGQRYSIPEGTALIPGENYSLLAEARDRSGREFSSDSGTDPVPADRLEIALDNMSPGNSPGTVMASGSGGQSGNYRLEVSYGGDSSLVRELEFPFESSIAQGPEPGDVFSLEILGQLNEIRQIAPGDEIPLEVRVSDVPGRAWLSDMNRPGSHATNEFRLPPQRLQVDVENGAYDPRSGVVRFDGNASGMLGKEYSLTVAYAGNPAVQRSMYYEPDFLAIVPLMEKDELTYTGQGGREGREGSSGVDGTRGNPSNRAMGRGGDGRSGGNGTNGQAGERGTPGPNLRIIGREVRSLDAQHRLVLFEVRVPGTPPEYYLRKIDSPPVTIVSRGGAGGTGGTGGDGGEGGVGGNAYFSGDGGDGGSAGGGGDGGEGGDGGNITLILASPDLEASFVLDSLGGVGGAGGDEGTSGQPGIPGSVDDWMVDEDDVENGSILPEVGAYGNEGNIGHIGRNGYDGLSGQVEILVNEDQAAALIRRVPAAIRDSLLY